MEKKIATSVDILVNIDRFEHLQVTKYAETKITYENEEEMIQKEDELTNQLINDVLRTIRVIPGKMGQNPLLGQKMDAVTKIEEKISKKMPAWLEEGGVPNINTAKKKYQAAVASDYSKKEENIVNKTINDASTDDFLSGKTEKVEKVEKVEKKVEEKDSNDNFFDDEDLFK